jgi:tRNA A37 threonylcarbamoyladenosine biosynthesis protein TsaE
VDLYRLADRLPDLREIGLEEILSESAAAVAVEWPRNTLIRWLPDDARLWRVELTIEEDGTRTIRVTEPHGAGPR